MELDAASEGEDSTGSRRAGGATLEGSLSPLENPAIDPIPDDPLLEPHHGEPGVCADGTAAPLENPDDRASADPLLSAG